MRDDTRALLPRPPRAGGTAPSRRTVLRGGLATMLAAPALLRSGRGARAAAPLGVVEMFTSQGCSSCPPADKVLAELVASGEAIGLSHHVDYWDYLGWKDTLGSPEATKRQYAYARAFGRRGVYTPQAVINGRSHHVGSRRAEVLAQLRGDAAAGFAPDRLVTISQDGDRLAIVVEGAAAEADLVLAHYDERFEQAIERGENRGRTIAYHHPVRAVESIGPWDGTTGPVTAGLPLTKRAGGVAVLLQSRAGGGAPGPILGAGSLALAGV